MERSAEWKLWNRACGRQGEMGVLCGAEYCDACPLDVDADADAHAARIATMENIVCLARQTMVDVRRLRDSAEALPASPVACEDEDGGIVGLSLCVDDE